MSLFTPPELSQEVRAPLVNKINRQGDVLFKKKGNFCPFDDSHGGVYQMDPLVRKVYGAESLVTVWSQEGGLVPSDGLQRSPNA